MNELGINAQKVNMLVDVFSEVMEFVNMVPKQFVNFIENKEFELIFSIPFGPMLTFFEE